MWAISGSSLWWSWYKTRVICPSVTRYFRICFPYYLCTRGRHRFVHSSSFASCVRRDFSVPRYILLHGSSSWQFIDITSFTLQSAVKSSIILTRVRRAPSPWPVTDSFSYSFCAHVGYRCVGATYFSSSCIINMASNHLFQFCPSNVLRECQNGADSRHCPITVGAVGKIHLQTLHYDIMRSTSSPYSRSASEILVVAVCNLVDTYPPIQRYAVLVSIFQAAFPGFCRILTLWTYHTIAQFGNIADTIIGPFEKTSFESVSSSRTTWLMTH